MSDVTYDPKADAIYISIARGAVAGTEDAGPLTYDVDSSGRILGIEILAASRVLAPGDWRNAPIPQTPRYNAAE